MEDLITVTVGVNKQAVVRVLLDVVYHPYEWSDSCAKRDYDIVFFELSRSYFSWQDLSLSYLSFPLVQIVTT